MINKAQIFQTFLTKVQVQLGMSEPEIDQCLEEIGGVEGTLRDDMYVSAYETIARHMVDRLDLIQIIDFIESNRDLLCQDDAQQYFFFWAMMDSLAAEKGNFTAVIQAAPEAYKEHLTKEFG